MFNWFKSKNPPPANISEPVYSIVKTFDEKGRWSMKWHESGVWGSYAFHFTDNETGEKCFLLVARTYWCSEFGKFAQPMPLSFKNDSPLPTWMTEEEKEYVISEVNKRMKVLAERIARVEDRRKKKSEAKSKIEQTKERQRVMGVYCK